MTIEEIKDAIKQHFTENNTLICTKRIESRLAQTIKNIMDSGAMAETKEAIEDKLNTNSTIEFLQARQPYLAPVENDVIDSIKDYMADGALSNFKPIRISRASNCPEDHYLYFVTGYNTSTDMYACWTCWNQMTKTLNYGHYNIPSLRDVDDLFAERFNDITYEPELYGPGYTQIEIDTVENLRNEKYNNNVHNANFSVVRKGR